MARKTPQEKKRHSYLRDRRNTYGESSKSSRKNIRRRKRHVSRANRRVRRQAIAEATAGYDPEVAEQIEARLLGKRPKHWAKFPDTPLGQVVQEKLNRRARLGIDEPQEVQAKVARIRKRTGQ